MLCLSAQSPSSTGPQVPLRWSGFEFTQQHPHTINVISFYFFKSNKFCSQASNCQSVEKSALVMFEGSLQGHRESGTQGRGLRPCGCHGN